MYVDVGGVVSCKCEGWQLGASGRNVASGPGSHQSRAELQVRKQHVMELIQPDVLYLQHLLVSDDTGDAWQHSSSLTSSPPPLYSSPDCDQPASSHSLGLYLCSKIFPSNETEREEERT